MLHNALAVGRQVDHIRLDPEGGQDDEGKVVVRCDNHAIARLAGMLDRGAVTVLRAAHIRGGEDPLRRLVNHGGGTNRDL